MKQNEFKEDYYVRKSKILGYRSRAAFKLIEINKKFNIIKPNDTVIDLGSYPGSWCQVLAKIILLKNKIVGVDLKKIEPIKNIVTIEGDFLSRDTEDRIIEIVRNPVDNIISDMSPKFCGQKDIDHSNIMLLVEKTFRFASRMLKKDGNFCVKIISGGTEKRFSNYIKSFFKKVSYFKPKSSTKSSPEIYLIGLKYKG
jgi:23S rRNA (uridine2552-2'-O)-methyltransferase